MSDEIETVKVKMRNGNWLTVTRYPNMPLSIQIGQNAYISRADLEQINAAVQLISRTADA